MKNWVGLCTLLSLTLLAGCNKTPDPQAKLAEAQKELETAQQKVAAAEAEQRSAAGAATTPPPAETASSTLPATVPGRPSGNLSIAPKAPGATPTAAPAAPKAAPKPIEVTIPAGTPIAIQTTNTLSTKTQKDGDPFTASLTKDLVIDGKTVAEKGAEVTGVVVNSDDGGRVKGRASLAVRAKSIAGVGGPIAISTGSYTSVAKSTVKRDVIRGGIMAGAGAAIGAIAGGGKGAAIGAGAGGAAGAGTAVATKGDPAVIAAESVLTLKTTEAVTVTLKP